jgi:DNA (cytosine-5)-methyltransferase 1
MDVGFERAGRFRVLACAELRDVFCETLEANRDEGRLGHPELPIFTGPIEDLSPAELMEAAGLRPGELDVLIGGPPCQTFSTAGRRETVQDPRGMLLWQFSRFVEALQPKYFVMENVRGLLSAAIDHRPLKERPDNGGPPLSPKEMPGSVVKLWARDLLRKTGGRYRVDCFEVNAVNYGAPQLRERVLFIGNRMGHLVEFPSPTHRNPYKPGESEADREMAPFATLGDALDTIEEDDGEVMDFSARKKSFLEMVPEGANWRALPEEVQQESMGNAWFAKGGRSGWWRRLSRDLPCPTIVTMPNHASTAMCHPTETRALTLRECAAVQGFPNDWVFRGTVAQKYTQVGNALPVRLAEVAAEVIAEHLEERPESVLASKATRKFRRVYLDSHVRTRQWYRAGETFHWRDGEDNSLAHYSPAARAAP